jgi:biotin carboxylase
MNIVYLSPHFPTNFINFSVNLNRLGVNVLGLADDYYDNLPHVLKENLTEYYQVNDMHNYDELVRACGYFTHRYGKIDRIESHNEYWIETEAALRTDFNVFGTKNDEIKKIKSKFEMKKLYKKAGVEVARGKVVSSTHDFEKFTEETGYPVVVKPDIGVGAAYTYKIHSDSELEEFIRNKPAHDYIIEEFIAGDIYSFDGLTDKDGNIVFYTSHRFSQGIMETVNQDIDIYYYSLRDIPEDLKNAGHNVAKAFNVREKFFHFEFFRLPDNRLVGLEVNIRPPGGLTTDMFNYANDIDIYREWANIVAHNKFTASYSRKYHCCYIGRKLNKNYAYSHNDITANFGDYLVHYQKISPVFAKVLGNYGYIFRTQEIEKVFEIINFVHNQGEEN